jgi:hypothetical protein
MVLLSGQAPSGYNVNTRIFNYLQQHAYENNIMYGFKGSWILNLFNILKGQFFIIKKWSAKQESLK